MWNADPMSGSAGSIMSMASGFSAMIAAITITNSVKAIGWWRTISMVSALVSAKAGAFRDVDDGGKIELTDK
ncbi:hypothetical protein SSBR45G_72480 [Bradyrhizobium sp. SSBR45G]|nr:hypothetical protein SSBR45G_72480 [Bradyrhizobium sp. SSBR45G]